MEERLGTEKYEIKKYAKFGLISFSEHSKERMRERGFNPIQIFEYLTNRGTTITQYKEIGSYNNHHPRFVMYGKVNKKPLHIVIEKQSINNTVRFEVVTVYEPNKKYFSHNGKHLRPAYQRR